MWVYHANLQIVACIEIDLDFTQKGEDKKEKWMCATTMYSGHHQLGGTLS